MNMRCASLACLALLWACGSDEGDSKSSASPPAASKPTSQPAPAKTPTDTSKSTSTTPVPPKAPAADKPLAEAKPKTAPTPPTDSAPGIVHTTPTTPPAGTTPSGTTPSGTTPSGTTPSGTAPSATTPSKPAPTPSQTAESVLPPTKPAQPDMTAPASTKEPAAVEKAVAHLSPASGSGVSGTVTFVRQPTGVEVHIVLEGLTPGAHGLHVHETGDCSAADAMTAGDHFNPGHAPHGGRDATERHAGDLGNVMADGAGKVDVTFTDRMLALSGESSILGRAVIVHADADDLVSQPVGNSGARVACGVIEEAKSTLSEPGGG